MDGKFLPSTEGHCTNLVGTGLPDGPAVEDGNEQFTQDHGVLCATTDWFIFRKETV